MYYNCLALFVLVSRHKHNSNLRNKRAKWNGFLLIIVRHEFASAGQLVQMNMFFMSLLKCVTLKSTIFTSSLLCHTLRLDLSPPHPLLCTGNCNSCNRVINTSYLTCRLWPQAECDNTYRVATKAFVTQLHTTFFPRFQLKDTTKLSQFRH